MLRFYLTLTGFREKKLKTYFTDFSLKVKKIEKYNKNIFGNIQINLLK